MRCSLAGIRKTIMREQLAPLEARVPALLGAEAAVVVPTGTMAQQTALRCWAEPSGNAVVAMHPTAHPPIQEE